MFGRSTSIRLKRRDFLVGSSAFTLSLPFCAQSVHSEASDNEGRLRIASVGVGGMGASDLGSLRDRKSVV